MIKAVIFDFGNVLYDLDFELFHENFSTLLGSDVTAGFPPVLEKAIQDYDTGRINTETFIWKFQHFMKGSVDPLDIINCWNSLLSEFPAHRWEFLERLSEQHKLYLLSNINELHLSTAYRHIKKVHGRIDFETKFFDAVFYSHMIGHAKPNIDLYMYVENGLKLAGNEIFFVDDKLENVEGAKNAGWKAVQHDPRKDIVKEFSYYLGQFLSGDGNGI